LINYPMSHIVFHGQQDSHMTSTQQLTFSLWYVASLTIIPIHFFPLIRGLFDNHTNSPPHNLNVNYYGGLGFRVQGLGIQVAGWLCPTVCAPSISTGQKWWQTVLEIKILCSQWESSASTQDKGSSFLLFGEEGWEILCFLHCSQCVSIMFPKYPNCSWRHCQ
jgi:hypothetical protein